MWPLWNWLSKSCLAIGGGVAFAASLGLAVSDNLQSATLCAGLFIMATLFHYIPQLESFKAFNIEAKLDRKINEAERLLDKIKSSSIASAENTFFSLGWGNRMASPSWETKFQVAERTIASLSSVGLTRQDYDKLLDPMLRFATWDCYTHFTTLLAMRIAHLSQEMNAKLTNLQFYNHQEMTPEIAAEREHLRRRLGELGSYHQRQHWKLDDASPLLLRPTLTTALIEARLDDESQSQAQTYLAKLCHCVEMLNERRDFNLETARLLDRAEDPKQRESAYEEVFGTRYEPSGRTQA